MRTKQLSKTIDHTLLRPDATALDIERLCREAVEHHFAAVCVFPYFVPLAAKLLRSADVKVCTVIAFPHGAENARSKVVAAEDAVTQGAEEVDVVINISALLSGEFTYVRDELASVVRGVRLKGINSGRGHIGIKAIIETCYLDAKFKQMACKICESAGVDFVKTSTGLGPKGATVADVELLRSCLSEHIGIKAAGGIRTVRDLELMLSAGAVRIGTSAGVAIMKDELD